MLSNMLGLFNQNKMTTKQPTAYKCRLLPNVNCFEYVYVLFINDIKLIKFDN